MATYAPFNTAHPLRGSAGTALLLRPAPIVAPPPALAVKPAKDASVETLRGLAILLVVAGHAVGSRGDSGLHVGDHSAYRYFYDLFADVRLPLFTVISGYLYGARPVIAGKLARFLKGKCRRILLPFLTVMSLQYLTVAVVDGELRERLPEMWRIYLYGFEQFWFLQSIFLIFLTVGALDAFGLLKRPAAFVVAIAVAVALYAFSPAESEFLNLFSFGGFKKLLPFFLLGYAIHRFWEHNAPRSVAAIFWAVLAVALALRQLEWFGHVAFAPAVSRALGAAVGVAAVTLLFQHRRPVPALAFLGSFAYGIFLFHSFGVAGARTALQALGLHATLPLLVLCLAAGLTLPILAEHAIRRSATASLLLLGLKSPNARD